MADENREYYQLTPGSFAHKAVTEFKSEFLSARDKWHAFADKYGTTKMYGGSHLEGLVFGVGTAPTGWTQVGRAPKGVLRPVKKYAPDAYKDLRTVPALPDGRDLGKRLGVDSILDGFSLCHPGFEDIGDQIILSLHKKMKIPDGAVKLKMSEYWALVEEAA